MIHVHCSRYIPDGVIISYELPFILKFIYPVESYLGYKSANLFSVLLLLQSDIRFFYAFCRTMWFTFWFTKSSSPPKVRILFWYGNIYCVCIESLLCVTRHSTRRVLKIRFGYSHCHVMYDWLCHIIYVAYVFWLPVHFGQSLSLYNSSMKLQGHFFVTCWAFFNDTPLSFETLSINLG